MIYRMDMELNVMIDAFMLFNEFEVYVMPEDQTAIENLRMNFDLMMQHVMH